MLVGAGDGDANDLALENVYQCENKEMPSDTTVVPLNSATNATQKHALVSLLSVGQVSASIQTSDACCCRSPDHSNLILFSE